MGLRMDRSALAAPPPDLQYACNIFRRHITIGTLLLNVLYLKSAIVHNKWIQTTILCICVANRGLDNYKESMEKKGEILTSCKIGQEPLEKRRYVKRPYLFNLWQDDDCFLLLLKKIIVSSLGRFFMLSYMF